MEHVILSRLQNGVLLVILDWPQTTSRRPLPSPSRPSERRMRSYQAGSWDRKRRVVAKVEWHPGELYPQVGFIVFNLSRPAESLVAFYNQQGKAEQFIKECKNAIKWTWLSCRKLPGNQVRL